MLQVEVCDGYVLLKLVGRLDGVTMEVVERSFVDILADGYRHYVIDLSQLDYISSAGLRAMLFMIKKSKAADGRLALCQLKPAVQEIFDLSAFSTIFAIFNCMDEAVAYVLSPTGG
ncbi:STAS domain-containing protein [Paenibacillus yanchengensis]|uniref:Anti-sigma factor antagonist n=1 Tax=Paenibacillus yanchengensis TaxID=2035833 RepID=A0ABW4YEL4_9BACL